MKKLIFFLTLFLFMFKLNATTEGKILLNTNLTQNNRDVKIDIEVISNKHKTNIENEIIFLIDNSNHMGGKLNDDDNNIINSIKEKLKNIDLLDSKIGFILFNEQVSSYLELTNKKEDINKFIDSINCEKNNSFLNVSDSFNKAISMFSDKSNKAIILLVSSLPTSFTINGLLYNSIENNPINDYYPLSILENQIEINKIINFNIIGINYESFSSQDIFYSSLTNNYNVCYDKKCLNETLLNINKSINKTSNNAELKITISNNFELKRETLSENVEVEETSQGNVNLIYNFDYLSNVESEKISFEVTAKEKKYGNLLAVKDIIFTTKVLENNPFYKNKNVSIKKDNLSTNIPVNININDLYSNPYYYIIRGQSVNINYNNLISNKLKIEKLIVDKESVSCGNVISNEKYITLSDTNNCKSIIFEYKITYEDNNIIFNSETLKASFKVIEPSILNEKSESNIIDVSYKENDSKILYNGFDDISYLEVSIIITISLLLYVMFDKKRV